MFKSHDKKNDTLNMQQLKLIQFSVDNAADAIFWLNKNGEFIYANSAAATHIGFSQEDLLSMTVNQIDHNFPVEKWQKHWEKMKRKKKMIFESLHRNKKGEILPVEINVTHLELDEIEFHCVYVRDITERKKAEEFLQLSEKRLRKTLDVTSDGMWDRNLVTGEVHYGSNWASSLGYLEEDLVAGKIKWEELLHRDDRERALQAVKDHIDGKTKSYEAEFRLKNSGNGWQWIHARGKVIEYGEDSRPLRFVGTHTDITNRKKAEDSLLKSSEDTKLFAYSVVHDLKNPVIAIQCLAERFRDKLFELSDGKKKKYCDEILSSSEQIAALVDTINSYITSKETSLVIEDVSLIEVVRICQAEFAAQLQIRNIIWNTFEEHPIIRADRISMIRVLRNLVENSFKYGGEQLSEISIGYKDTSDFYVISVRDNGMGMQEEDSERLFKPFERRASSIGQGGSGLGLAIVKEIAEHHNGEVWVEQNPKSGIQFCFAIAKDL